MYFLCWVPIILGEGREGRRRLWRSILLPDLPCSCQNVITETGESISYDFCGSFRCFSIWAARFLHKNQTGDQRFLLDLDRCRLCHFKILRKDPTDFFHSPTCRWYHLKTPVDHQGDLVCQRIGCWHSVNPVAGKVRPIILVVQETYKGTSISLVSLLIVDSRMCGPLLSLCWMLSPEFIQRARIPFILLPSVFAFMSCTRWRIHGKMEVPL